MVRARVTDRIRVRVRISVIVLASLLFLQPVCVGGKSLSPAERTRCGQSSNTSFGPIT